MSTSTTLRNFARVSGGAVSIAIRFALVDSSILSVQSQLSSCIVSRVIATPSALYSADLDPEAREVILSAFARGYAKTFD